MDPPSSATPSGRRTQFKKGIDADSARNRRVEKTLSLRKKKQEELLKRRRAPEGSGASDLGSGPGVGGQGGVDVQEKLQKLPEFLAMIMGDDPQAQVEGTRQFRKLLSVESNPPIKEVISTGCVPRLVSFLHLHEHPDLQFEASWTLTNIASGSYEETKVVMDSGATPLFVELLASPNVEVREQSIWALGNIAGDSPQCRDYVLSLGVMPALLQQFRSSERISVLRNATWTLSNLTRGKPAPKFEGIRQALPVLAQLLYYEDDEVLTDACWAISYMSDGSNEQIGAVVESGVVRRLVELLMHPRPVVLTAALRTIGNIVTGTDEQTQAVINAGALPCLLSLMSSPKKGIRKEACWTLSNITAGTQQQVQAVIDNNLIPPLIHMLQTAEFDVRKEAAWGISNAASGGTDQQIAYMVERGCIKPLCDLLTCPDAKIISVAIEGLEHILRSGERVASGVGSANPYAGYIEEADGLSKLEELQRHDNNEVYDKAVAVLENFFDVEEEEDDAIAPQQGESGTFAFNAGMDAPQGGFNF